MEKFQGLDGLRAIFVLVVLIFHIFLVFYPESVGVFGGGFLGVESFFVLSGFLITNSLINKYSKDGLFYGLIKFLKGRYLRLYPAFVFLILIQIVVISSLFPQHTEKFLSELVAGSFNVYNWWLIFRNVPYFEKFSDTLFNLHLWSLSMEWQFYLIWALIFLLLSRYDKKFLNIFILLSIILSVSDMFILYHLYDNVDRVYFGTDSRFFSFLIGSFLAVNIEKVPVRRVAFFVLGIVGILLLASSYVFLNSYEDYMYPFGFLYISFLTVFVILSVLKSDYFNLVLSILPLKWIGERSYSIYLWHYPVFVMLNLLYSNKYIDVVLIGIVITFFISNLSYTFVEEPFRKLDFSRVLSLKSLSNLAASLTVIGFSLGYLSTIQPEEKSYEKAVSLKLDEDKVASYEVKIYPEKENSEKSDEEIKKEIEKDSTIDDKIVSSEVFIIGDSVMLGASDYIKKYIPNSYVDAKVGRQFDEIFNILSNDKISGYKKVIIALGNNGYIRKSDLEEVLDKLQDKEVYLVTVKVPKPWQNKVNSLFWQVASERPNVHVVDWYSVSKDNEDIFVSDKVHLNPKGAKFYASLIKDYLSGKSNLSRKKKEENVHKENEEKAPDVENIELNSEGKNSI